MIVVNAAVIQPARLDATEMAQILAAFLTCEEDVLALVVAIAPCSARRIVEELTLVSTGGLALDEMSSALRWILPEIHAELGSRYPALEA